MAVDGELQRINEGLRQAGLTLRLERRGGRLGLRGPLPRRDGGEGLRTQRLSLGLPADATGLAEALRQLHRIEAQLAAGVFRWPTVAAATAPPARASDPLDAPLDDFERSFFDDPRRRRSLSGGRSTWTAAYLPYLRRLRHEGRGQPLSSALLQQVLATYPPASRSRQQCGLVLGLLARQEGLALPDDWREQAAGYGLHRARFRAVPSDGATLEAVLAIPSPSWRLAYGLMATYGLRNHEVFYADFSDLAPRGEKVLRVLPTTKTGEHQVWPFQPDWVDRFGLGALADDPGRLPAVCTDLRRTTLQQVGRRVAEQFQRYRLPLTPYDLRHAWALRTIHLGLPDTVAARMMGHSVTIHTRTYHHWITRRDQQRAVDDALGRRSA
jgi:integrase